MKHRKRRRTMRPLDSLGEDTPMHRFKRRSTDTKLCVNGMCSAHIGNEPVEAPSAFSEGDKASHLSCENDGLRIIYNGPGGDEKDAASIRSNAPIPLAGLAIYYFEILIENQGLTGRIGVGLCGRDVKLEKMPGWEGGSFAYHGDDGLLFRENGVSGASYGPKYGTDDVIGCCWDLVDGAVFFTKNGKALGTAFSNLSGTLYPTIGMQSRNGQIKANFGRHPFVYDIEGYAQQQRERVLSSVMAQTLPGDYRVLSDTVLAYLMHNGYAETAAAFAKDAGREKIYERESQSMMQRQAVCRKVLVGDIDGAIRDLEMQFPHVLNNQLNMRFLLRTQKFIEMLVSGASPEETVNYGRRELSVFSKNKLKSSEANEVSEDGADAALQYDDILGDVYLLLAYGNPAESPAGHLTKQSRREMVAESLNSAILASQGRPMRSILERLISQSENVFKHVLKLDNGPSALVSVQDLL